MSLNSRLPSLTCASWGRPTTRYYHELTRSGDPSMTKRAERFPCSAKVSYTQYSTVIAERTIEN